MVEGLQASGFGLRASRKQIPSVETRLASSGMRQRRGETRLYKVNWPTENLLARSSKPVARSYFYVIPTFHTR
jgi:hypothetical protein